MFKAIRVRALMVKAIRVNAIMVRAIKVKAIKSKSIKRVTRDMDYPDSNNRRHCRRLPTACNICEQLLTFCRAQELCTAHRMK